MIDISHELDMDHFVQTSKHRFDDYYVGKQPVARLGYIVKRNSRKAGIQYGGEIIDSITRWSLLHGTAVTFDLEPHPEVTLYHTVPSLNNPKGETI